MSGEQNAPVRMEIGHVLAMDIVGYSTLLIHEQSELLQRLNEIARGTNQFRAADAEGKLIRLPTGDGMALVFFNDPQAPIECAMEIATALKSYPEIKLRMGIHSGPINEVLDVNERTNVAGAGIDLAQRVMDCGDAGHILLSKRVADDLAPFSRWHRHLHDLGECAIKHGRRISLVNFYNDEIGNAQSPERLIVSAGSSTSNRRFWLVGVFILSLITLAIPVMIFIPAILRSSHGRERKDISLSSETPVADIPDKSIAVLPFENRSDDKANEYFADGIQDEILTRLSKIADLKVISRTSTQHYKSAPTNLSEVGRQLRVTHVVEGSVQKSGDSVRVNVQLIKAANDSHLWADTYDRRLTDIFSVESEVAKAIADQLRAKLTGREEQIIAAKPTDNREAYDAYLRGVANRLKTSFTPANIVSARRYLKEAVNLDPKFSQAWAMLSHTDADGYITSFLPPTDALREETLQAAETALTLQPDLGEAIAAKGHYYYSCLKDYDTAERYLEQARQFLPNSSQVPALLAYVNRRRGQWDRSDRYFAEAERLDPRNTNLLGQHAFSYVNLRRFSEAQQKLDEILDITPDDVDTIATKAAIAQAEGDLPRASALLAPLHPAPNNTLAIQRQVYQAVLERRPASIIAQLEQILADSDPTSDYFSGELRFWLGWTQELAGDHSAAEESWRQARRELESFLKQQPRNHFILCDLALVNMGLGDKAAAVAIAERAIAVCPIEKDSAVGSQPLEVLARVAAGMGEPDRAIAAIEKLLSIPVSGFIARTMPMTPALLRLDPMFDPLRNQPRFRELVASP